MRYVVIQYDKESVRVVRMPQGTNLLTAPGFHYTADDVLCEGSSFGDVVKALEQAFGEEMKQEGS